MSANPFPFPVVPRHILLNLAQARIGVATQVLSRLKDYGVVTLSAPIQSLLGHPTLGVICTKCVPKGTSFTMCDIVVESEQMSKVDEEYAIVCPIPEMETGEFSRPNPYARVVPKFDNPYDISHFVNHAVANGNMVFECDLLLGVSKITSLRTINVGEEFLVDYNYDIDFKLLSEPSKAELNLHAKARVDSGLVFFLRNLHNFALYTGKNAKQPNEDDWSVHFFSLTKTKRTDILKWSHSQNK